MAEKGTRSDHSMRVFWRVTRWYFIALTVIALVVLISHWLIQGHLINQLNDSRIVNVSGRQRMLSQQLAKQVLKLLPDNTPAERKELRRQIQESLNLWVHSFHGLRGGDSTLQLPGQNSEAILQMFDDINEPFQNMHLAALEILDSLDKNINTNYENLLPAKKSILNNEGMFLNGMNNIVFQYDKEAKAKIVHLRKVEFFLLLFTLIALILELIFIFIPTAKYVRRNMRQLANAQEKAIQKTIEIENLYKAKEQSVQKLRALNYALDQATLFASITLDGNLTYISEKLSAFLGYKGKKPIGQLSTVLTKNDVEQQYIDQLIRSLRSSIWTGEVSITDQTDEKKWLELSFVPVNRKGVKQDYLLICSDITPRKTAQAELQKLNQERFELEIQQQKLLSAQVIDAQEKERQRIARDMHDGIGQMLTALKFNLEAINLEKIDKAKLKLEGTKELAANLIKGVRIATFNLTPPELTDYGISPALSKLCSELQKLTGKNILFENKTNFDQRLDPIIETNLYRISQEAVNNAIKYANSSYILLAISHSEDLLSISIDDNGLGLHDDLNTSQKSETTQLGLSFMKERVKFINGRLFIRSEKGKGTRITVNVPI
ncbi:MAG: PAS domain S-box protein [Saprospiraceae bacterium]|nr:PAS domain S-box protein [Saprospiraceae bacterium]